MTRYITKEVEAPDTFSVNDESNQLAFVAGLVVAFLIMSVVVLIVCLVYRRRTKLDNQIVIRDGLPVDVGMEMGGRGNMIIMQDTPADPSSRDSVVLHQSMHALN